MEKLTGYQREDLLNYTILLCYDDMDAAGFWVMLMEMAITGKIKTRI